MSQVDVSAELEPILEQITSLMDDSTIPRNIRQTLKEAAEKLRKAGTDEGNIALSSVMYKLDDINNDVNMPSHTRTEIWSLISALESLKEKLK